MPCIYMYLMHVSVLLSSGIGFSLMAFPQNTLHTQFMLISFVLQLDDASTIKNSDIAKELSLPPVKLHCSSESDQHVWLTCYIVHIVYSLYWGMYIHSLVCCHSLPPTQCWLKMPSRQH